MSNNNLESIFIMKAIKTFLFTSLMVFLPVILSAQTVSGKLIDEKEKPLPFANVVLLSLPDSAFERTDLSLWRQLRKTR